MPSEHIHYDVTDGIATITIDRPEKRNALNYAMYNTLIERVDEAEHDPAVRVILLTAVPGQFCAGTDLSELRDVDPNDPSSDREEFREGKQWYLHDCSKPVIAAIDGPAAGLGVELATLSDIRIASTRAKFSWIFVRRGLVPDTGAGTWLLPRIVGLQNALYLVMTADYVDAAKARELGFLFDVVEPEQLAGRAREIAAMIALGSPFAVERVKRLLRHGQSQTRNEHLDEHLDVLTQCQLSEDHHEGVAAFLEKRPAVFVGK
ncbi:MAG TPA: enoyl-CoA hydratase/isomerase family protein [Jatrophihabitans sp.]|jgi:enoyl-CoA hydratase/carnithine racemase|uniref:enoyl-CoA hydratase/isomerase family protein n=1 Tax=Jatrophihabitans sp. TaxID=1932789 RepID=UPI002E0547F8|nr:enoyl-CoA hydratase/isomerase family protein [Jatrophihabitans sp.]